MRSELCPYEGADFLESHRTNVTLRDLRSMDDEQLAEWQGNSAALLCTLGMSWALRSSAARGPTL